MKVDRHPCYLLHQRPYRETSSILEILSMEYGRFSLVAKGIKRKKSKYAGLLRLYQRLQLGWQGKGELKNLIFAEQDGLNISLGGNSLIAAFYLNELVIKLLHRHESHVELFTAYDRAVNDLHTGNSGIQAILRIFEKKLLESIGYGLIFDHDINENVPIDDNKIYYYRAGNGPQLKKPENSDYIKVSGKTLKELDKENIYESPNLIEAKQLMRYIISKYLNGSPMLSRNIYQAYLSNTRQ